MLAQPPRVEGRVAIDVFWYGQTSPLHPCVEHPQHEMKDALIAQFALWTPLGHGEGGKINALNSVAESWTGIGVVAGFCATELMMQRPHVKHVDTHWSITLRQILRAVRSMCKTRTQLKETSYAKR
jgi:hypothetical protein